MKELELSRYDAQKRLLLFLKLRKGKTVTEKTISDFDKLMDSMYQNFKDYDDVTITKFRVQDDNTRFEALKAIRCGFMSWESGGNCRLTDIDDFSSYTDGKYRAKVKGEKIEISKTDFHILQYIFFGERQ